MRMRSPALLLILLAACGPGETREAVSEAGTYRVAWTPSPAPIPFSELFAIDVEARTPSGTPAETLTLDVRMPAHGHGMQTRPTVEARGDGVFHVEGLMFHMRGAWELTFSLEGEAGGDKAIFREEFR